MIQDTRTDKIISNKTLSHSNAGTKLSAWTSYINPWNAYRYIQSYYKDIAIERSMHLIQRLRI